MSCLWQWLLSHVRALETSERTGKAVSCVVMNRLNKALGQGPGASLVFLRGGEAACRLGLAWELGLPWVGLCPRRGCSLRSEPHGGLRGPPCGGGVSVGQTQVQARGAQTRWLWVVSWAKPCPLVHVLKPQAQCSECDRICRRALKEVAE